MSQCGLDNFGAYRKALELFDLVVADMALLQKDPRCYRLIAQQTASADSICANIEEGYGRLGRREYIRFLDFARGSARETQGRYRRMKHWLGQDVIEQRSALCGEIIAFLTSSINSLQASLNGGASSTQAFKETGTDYVVDPVPSTLDTCPLPLTLDT